MASIQFLGLASGTDWNSVISQLVAVERRPIDKIIEARDKVNLQRAATQAASDQLRKLNSSLSTLRLESTFLSRKAESSSTARVSATADARAAKGSYSVEIQRLARAGRASSGLNNELYSKVANMSTTQTMGINTLTPTGDFQPTRALASTLIKDTQQAGKLGAAITKGDTISISGNLKNGTAVSGTFTFNDDGTDTLERLATAIAQVFHGEIAGSVGSNGELTFIERDPTVAGDVTFNTTVPPLALQFNDVDYSGSTLEFGIGNNVAGAGGTARRLVGNQTFTTAGAPQLNDATDLATLDQVVSGVLNNGDIIRITGTETSGSAITSTDFTYTGAAGGQTIADLINTISSAYTSATATYQNGRIVLTATASGLSSLSLNLEFVDSAPATEFNVGGFDVAETGRAAVAQMITSGGFTVEGKGEHLLTSTDGKAGLVHGTVTLMDPSNTLSSYGVSEFDMFSIDPDGAGSLGPIAITGLSEYSTLQDLVDAINEQAPAVTAQLLFTGSDYRLDIASNRGGQDIRIYDAANGLIDKLMKTGATTLDSSTNDASNTFGATTNTTDVTIIDTFTPANGGPVQRRFWTGAEGGSITQLIGGVAINGAGGEYLPGVAVVLTADSSELNTQQDMYSYLMGSNNIAVNPPTHSPAIDPALSLAEAGFAITPQNAADNPLFHTNGFFTINGVQINVGDVNATTINEVLGAINSSGAGVTAYFDTANQRFYLRNSEPGAEGISLGGGGDTSNFLQLAGLLTTAGSVELQGQAKGNVDTELPLAQAGFTQTPTSGIFTINGVHIVLDSGVDTLDDIIKKINNSGAGVTASYDSISDRLTLEQKLTSSMTRTQIEVGDPADTSNFLEAAMLTADSTVRTSIGTIRQTAEFTVNGNTFTRNSNTVDDVLDKVKLTLSAVTDGPESITISGDTERTKNAMLDFIVQYNTTMELLNAKNLNKSEREKTVALTEEAAKGMTTAEIEDYFTTRNALLARDFFASDNTTRQVVRRIQNLVTGLVRNDGTFQSLSQIGLSTAEVGAGVEAAAESQGRLLGPYSDKETLTQLLNDSADFQSALTDSDEDLYQLFSNALQSRITHTGGVSISTNVSLSSAIQFSIGDGTNTATVSLSSGIHSKTSVLNTINSQLNSAGLSNSMLAFYDAQSQLSLRVTQTNSQAVLQLLDQSTGADSIVSAFGWLPGVYLGSDPSIAGGTAQRTRDYVSGIIGTDGIIRERIKDNGSFDRIISNYNDTISRMEANLSDYEQRLKDKFARLETQLASMNTQSQALESAIAKASSSTSSN